MARVFMKFILLLTPELHLPGRVPRRLLEESHHPCPESAGSALSLGLPEAQGAPPAARRPGGGLTRARGLEEEREQEGGPVARGWGAGALKRLLSIHQGRKVGGRRLRPDQDRKPTRRF